MPNSRDQDARKADAFRQQDTFKKDPAWTLSDEEIRTRAYQIYESGNRNGNNADGDWMQAETELMNLRRAK
jgi:Protein of unknown function (DUF2934)